MKVIDSFWNSSWGDLIHGRECIGILLCEDEKTKGRQVYIGKGSGKNAAKDTVKILKTGTPLNVEVAVRIANFLLKED